MKQHPSNKPSQSTVELVACKCVPGLYVIATPIGNLRDMTLRALETLMGLDVLYCEDPRVTRKLLSSYGVGVSTSTFHDHSTEKVIEKILGQIADGKAVGLVSDAGTPLLSDPGHPLIGALLERGVPITMIPGVSSITTLLPITGLPLDRWMFVGFLPATSGKRQNLFRELIAESSTLVAFERMSRIAATLEDVQAVMGERIVVLGRELTKLHEQVVRGTPSEILAQLKAGEITEKGELVLVISGAREAAQPSADELDHAIRDGLKQHSPKALSEILSGRFGMSRKQVYQQILELKNVE